MDLSFRYLSHTSALGFRFLCGEGANWRLEQSSVGHFPLASPFPSTDTQALLHRHHSLAAGKTLGTRLNFSTPGKFLLGHFGRGGGTGLGRESATFCAPPCRGSRSSLKAALLRASERAGELPPDVCPESHSTTQHYGPCYAPATVESAAAPGGIRSWSCFSICPRYPPRIPLAIFCCLPGTGFLARLSLGPCLRGGQVAP